MTDGQLRAEGWLYIEAQEVESFVGEFSSGPLAAQLQEVMHAACDWVRVKTGSGPGQQAALSYMQARK